MRAFAVSVSVILLVVCSHGQQAADLVIVNGNVRTMSDRMPRAEAVAIIGNKIAAVGTNAEIKKLVTGQTRVIDAKGGLVLPGFNDSHVHFMGIGNKFSSLDLRGLSTADDLYDRLRYYSKFLPKGRWILGSGGSEALWKQIDAEKLDSSAPNNPVFLYSRDTRSAIANSASFITAKITEKNLGIVRDSNFERIRRYVPSDHTRRWAELAETASNYAVFHGITSVQDTDSDDHAELYRELTRQGTLKVRIYDCHGLSEWKKYADAGMKAASGDSMVRTGCLKGTADVDGEGKAALLRDVIAADKSGMQVLLHAIGPIANRTALDVFEQAIKANGKRDRRFRIEHAERSAPEDIPRFARLGVVASMQPHLFGWETRDAYAYRRSIRHGIKVALGSDAPMTDIDPVLGIVAAWKGIKLADAIEGYSVGSANAEFQQNVKGSLEVGKLADIVIFDDHDINLDGKFGSVKLTLVDGKVVYPED